MASLFIPDNTVLVNFATIGRMDLLRELAAGRSTWCYTVSVKSLKSSAYPGLEQLAECPGIFGVPLKLETRRELSDTQSFRTQLSKPGDSTSANLGEAESLAIITNRGLAATFVTDDNGAQRFAASNGIRYLTTWDLLKLFTRLKWLTREDSWRHVQTLGGQNRKYPALRTRNSYFLWLESPSSLA